MNPFRLAIRALNFAARSLNKAGHRIEMVVLKLNIAADTIYLHESLRREEYT